MTDVPRSLARTLDLLEAVVAEPSSGLTHLADATALTPSTALRYLRALEFRDYVHRDNNGSFHPGPAIMRVARAVTADVEQLTYIAQPHLDALAAQSGESCYLAVACGDIVTYVAAAQSQRALRHVGWVGQSLPRQGTAVGQALHEPGTIAVKTGAIEADITAVSLALPERNVAISVVGPAHRIEGPNTRTIADLLAATVAKIATQQAHLHSTEGIK